MRSGARWGATPGRSFTATTSVKPFFFRGREFLDGRERIHLHACRRWHSATLATMRTPPLEPIAHFMLGLVKCSALPRMAKSWRQRDSVLHILLLHTAEIRKASILSRTRLGTAGRRGWFRETRALCRPASLRAALALAVLLGRKGRVFYVKGIGAWLCLVFWNPKGPEGPGALRMPTHVPFPAAACRANANMYRGTSPIRKRTPLGPSRRPMPRVIRGS